MFYTSTRSSEKKYSFSEVLFSGVAPDGGLFYPDSIPKLSPQEIDDFSKQNYSEIAQVVLGKFLSPELGEKELAKVIKKSYSSDNFLKNSSDSFNSFATPNSPALEPIDGQLRSQIKDQPKNRLEKSHLENPLQLIQLRGHGGRAYFLELFHGPTLAFKDFALQFLANLMEHYLEKDNKKILILGATSGDTGSATIEAFKKIKQAKIFILHPHEAVSPKQRLQMTTVLSPNVFNLALKGNFDDCQNLVKAIFRSSKSIGEYTLVSVNSINFARIMAQIVYYFYAFSRIEDISKNEGLDFIVPTGNFGNIFAGYLAKKMGLPIKKLVIATNENDVLDEYLKKNLYEKKSLVKTFSPSMDIVVSSNFERLIFDITKRNHEACKKAQEGLEREGRFSLSKEVWEEIKKNFSSLKTTKEETLDLIEKVFKEQGQVIDPHSIAALKYFYNNAAGENELKRPSVALGTAHPAKFDEVYEKVQSEEPIEYADPLKALLGKEERYFTLDNSLKEVLDFIKENS